MCAQTTSIAVAEAVIDSQTYKLRAKQKCESTNEPCGKKWRIVLNTRHHIKSHNFAVSRNENLGTSKFSCFFPRFSRYPLCLGRILFAFVSHLLTNYCYHMSLSTGCPAIVFEDVFSLELHATHSPHLFFSTHSLRCIHHKHFEMFNAMNT